MCSISMFKNYSNICSSDIWNSSLIIKMLIGTGHLESSSCHKQILRTNMYSLCCGYLNREKRGFKFSYKIHNPSPRCLYSFLINPTKQMCTLFVSRIRHCAGCLLPACQHVVRHDSLCAVSTVCSFFTKKKI